MGGFGPILSPCVWERKPIIAHLMPCVKERQLEWGGGKGRSWLMHPGQREGPTAEGTDMGVQVAAGPISLFSLCPDEKTVWEGRRREAGALAHTCINYSRDGAALAEAVG